VNTATKTTAPAQPVGDVFNEPQAAAYLSVEVRTLALWRKTRGLPHIKLSAKCIRYRKPDIDSWLERFRQAIVP
jgi:hypothetical protein